LKKKPSQSSFSSVQDIILNKIDQFSKGKFSKSINLQKAWPRIVGDTIANHSKVLFVKDEKLYVQVSHSAWHSELKLMQGMILDKIKEMYPDNPPTEIKIKTD